MAMQSEGKDKKGGNAGQAAKDWTGNTGAIGTQHNDWGHSDVGAGNRQSGSRTDDLLAPDAEQEQGRGFKPEPGGQHTRK